MPNDLKPSQEMYTLATISANEFFEQRGIQKRAVVKEGELVVLDIRTESDGRIVFVAVNDGATVIKDEGTK